MYTEKLSESYGELSISGTGRAHYVDTMARAGIRQGLNVKVISGPLEGLEGVVTCPRSRGQWLIRAMGSGCYIELDGSLIAEIVR